MLKEGDRIPDVTVKRMTDSGPEDVSMKDYAAGRKIIVFAVPGPFTPTCSESHLPGFVAREADLRDKGVEAIACLSTADFFVMDAWGRQVGVGDKIDMLADGNHAFTEAAGMSIDLSVAGLGMRSTRYAMIVDDGTVTYIAVEDNPGQADVSSADAIIAKL